MARLPALFVPLVTLGWVGVWVLWIGAPRPIRAARLWGGPTDGLAKWSGWVEAANEDAALSEVELSLVVVDQRGNVQRRRPRLDAEGRAELSLDFGDAPPISFQAALREGETELAEGSVSLAKERWLSAARRRGGYLPTKSRGALRVAVAPERGALAVPFPSALIVRVESARGAVSGASIHATSEGAELLGAALPTNGEGLTRLRLTPNEHVVTLLIEARSETGEAGELSTSVPIVPGALFVERQGAALRVTAPSERERAFVVLVTEQGRLFGSNVQLTPTRGGAAVGLLPLPGLPSEPVWAVARNDVSEPSRARVGWPLFLGASEPARTLDVDDVLLLDGWPKARAQEATRRLRARRYALLGGILGALLSVGSVLTRAVKSQRELGLRLREQLDRAAFERVAPRARLRSALFMFLILLGFLVISLVLAWRLGSGC